MPPNKNLSRGSLSNWCDADADTDADSSETIFRSPNRKFWPYTVYANVGQLRSTIIGSCAKCL